MAVPGRCCRGFGLMRIQILQAASACMCQVRLDNTCGYLVRVRKKLLSCVNTAHVKKLHRNVSVASVSLQVDFVTGMRTVQMGQMKSIAFTDFKTETDRDEVLVLGGSKVESASAVLSRLSGDQVVGTSRAMRRSSNNFLIIKFSSDATVQFEGFTATWTAVQTGYPETGLILESETFFKTLNSFGYPTDYLANQETVYIIKSQQAREVLTLEIQDLDLAEGDTITIRDGPLSSSPLLAEITASSIQQRFILSTGPNMRLFFKTNSGGETTKRGFSFQYKTGCLLVVIEDNGVLSSPGYPSRDYMSSQECIWTVNAPSGRPVTLRIDSGQFDIHPSDSLQVLFANFKAII
ncbi:fibropellin-1 [Elysia marginata]|uniref:Fibropellin-1 n=1 Tax=Elysia marginata TaxID=1093978 RepID=A0AAV4HP56_9GAST|nr:fibropellin-1 [Elysia marginata]